MSGERCDIPQRLPALAGLCGHPDSSERALEKISQANQVNIAIQFPLTLGSAEHSHQRCMLSSRSLSDDLIYLRISLPKLTDRIHAHAAFRARQISTLGEADKGVSYRRECRTRFFESGMDGVDTLGDVCLECSQKQRSFIPEGVVHTLPADIHDAHQLVGGCGGNLRRQDAGILSVYERLLCSRFRTF